MATKPARLPRDRRVTDLAELLGGAGEDYPYHYTNARIRLSRIIVLPQPRQTFELIEELAEDIAQKGILNPPTIARFRPAAFRRYLAVINHLWKTAFEVKDFQPAIERGTQWYYVLLAGERRFRACVRLWNEGCERCRGRGDTADGACFRKHFRSRKIDVRLCVDIPPLPALFLQLSENTHIRVPEYEEAYAYSRLFGLLREADPAFPLARFARRVGRSPGTIQRAMKFCELPRAVQELVEDGVIRYGIAVEITRLQTNGFTEDDLLWWAQRAVAKGYTVPDFRTLITARLVALQSGQMDLLHIMADMQESERKRMLIRRTVAEGAIITLWQWIHYFQTLLSLFNRGLLGTPESPFSLRSPRRVLRSMLDSIEQLEPHLAALLSKADRERVGQELPRMRALLKELDVVASEVDPEPSLSHGG